MYTIWMNKMQCRILYKIYFNKTLVFAQGYKLKCNEKQNKRYSLVYNRHQIGSAGAAIISVYSKMIKIKPNRIKNFSKT